MSSIEATYELAEDALNKVAQLQHRIDNMLTPDELRALDLITDVANMMGRIVGDGPMRDYDMNELALHIHALQRDIMKQAAARAYPSKFRLLGQEV